MLSRVLVFDAQGAPLAPCHPARARQLLHTGRATVASQTPYAIRLTATSGVDTAEQNPPSSATDSLPKTAPVRS